MKIQEVILRALDGKLTWLQAADILGRSPRSIRRLRRKFERYGYDGLFDRRRQTPSPKRAPVAEVQRLLALYRDRYQGFNVRHFHQRARREHGVGFCYAFVKKALQTAGLVPTHRPRGRHRRRREPRPCFGELLHLDGSRHHWLALVPDQWLTLLAVVDDATKKLLYAELWEGGESVHAVMTALRAVLQRSGLPMALYTDRAHWAVHTPTSGAAPDRTKLTQVGRALKRLGIEHILGYSPQARGRSERVNRTLQDRLVNELRVAGIRTVAAANRYLRTRFIPAFNAEFGRPPADRQSAFVPLGRIDLEQILCVEEERVVGRDNVVAADGVPLQLDKQRGRRTCAGLHVVIRRHLDGQHSVWYGARCLGRFDGHGLPLSGGRRPRPARRSSLLSHMRPRVSGSRPAPRAAATLAI
jgi:transposase